MSVIPEVILHRVLVNGLRKIRKDNRILDTLFRNLDQASLNSMKEVVNKQSISFTINYPRQGQLNTPAIALLLKSEQEAQTFLGDVMGASPHYEMPDTDLSYDTLGGHGASVSDLSGLPKKLIGPLRVDTATYDEDNDYTRIRLSDSHITEMGEFLEAPPPCSDLYVVGGQGAGQKARILNFRSTGLDIDGRFDPQLDSSSLVDVRVAIDTGLAVGEPSRVYDANATNLLRKGANYNVQYQLSIIADHQDEVLFLYTVVKAILFSQKAFMEEQGIMALKISGSDFAPRTEFLPSEVFQRVMTIEFIYPFSYLEEIDVAEGFSVDLTPSDPDGETCSTISFDIVLDD